MVGILVLACGVLCIGIIIHRYWLWLYFAGRTALQGRRSAGTLDAVGHAGQCMRVSSAGVARATPIHTLQTGDMVIVRSGELIPADGIITAGAAWVAPHQLGGGSRRQVKKVHHRVCANHLVLAGCIFVQVEPQAGEA